MDMKLLVFVLVALSTSGQGSPVDNLWRHARQNNQDIRFLGVGYDLLKGNPDGDVAGGSVTDPGLKPSRKVLKVSFTDGSAIKVNRNSCIKKETIYENNESYQKKLRNEISVSGSASYMGASFTASAGFKGATDQTRKQHTIVFEKNELCALGVVRYKLELVTTNQYTVSDSFASEICALPTTYESDKSAYMNYLQRWGTHAVVELQLGTRQIERKKTSSTEVIKYAEQQYDASVGFSASGFGASGSLQVDISGFKSENSFKNLFQSSLTSYNVGTNQYPEPIKLHLIEVTEVLQSKFWSNLADLKSKGTCQSGFTLANAVSQMTKALEAYPQFLQVEAVANEPVRIPLLWPIGTYGLIKPKLSCAKAGSGDNTLTTSCPGPNWYTGKRFHDSEDDDNANKFTPSEPCFDGYVNHRGVELHFCMQHDGSGQFKLNWPKGSYCIFKKGNCPQGFTVGMVRFDDEDNNNSNLYSGYLPDGDYTPSEHATKYYFCCREDAFPTKKIYLPIGKPFYLIARKPNCQQVYGMSVTAETIYFDDEDKNNGNGATGMVPWNYHMTENHQMLLCYYKKQ